MNCPHAFFEGNEMGNYELTWSGLTGSTAVKLVNALNKPP